MGSTHQTTLDREAEPRWKVGIDIGGTFTDVILLGPDAFVQTVKVLSTPPDFEVGVMTAIDAALGAVGLAPERLERVVHGTTVATNAILEDAGSVTGVLTTRGFRDVLELGRLRRPSLYDLQWEKPVPLARRRHRLELDQRIAADGSVLRDLDEDEVRERVSQLTGAGVESVAICLINSYVKPEVERRVAQLVRQSAPHLYVTASVDVSCEMHEFERLSTAVVNSYVGPVVDRYVSNLGDGLRQRGIAAPLTIMQSTGGLLEADVAVRQPVQIIESGPAAGVIGVQRLAAVLGLRNVVAFDMGGTTAKASLIEDGEPFVAADYEVGGGMNVARGLGKGAGYAIRFPSIDIAEVGSGGGSIIHADAAGALHVGPQSAQAFPGPACYGRGGEAPTLTDANVALGYLSPDGLAGGTVDISTELAEKVLAEVAESLGLDTRAAARGSFEVAVSTMTQAVKAVTSERGRDPRDSVLVAFGGAGPLYGASLARELGITTVIVPRHPGLFSAVGLLTADTERQAVRPLEETEDVVEQIQRGVEEMEAELVREMAHHHGEFETVELQRIADMRYRGQRFELRIPMPPGVIDDSSLQRCRDLFHDEHRRTYGRSGSDDLVQFVNVRVIARLRNETQIPSILSSGVGLERDSVTRLCRFDRDLETPVMSRRVVGSTPSHGPAIVEDMDSTVLIPPGALFHRDHLDNIVIVWPAEREESTS